MADIGFDEVKDLYVKLKAANSARNAEYDLSRQRYGGVLWDQTTNPPPPDRYSLTANYLKPFTDKSIQSLVGKPPACQVMPKGTDGDSRRHAEQLEGVIYAAWEANEAPTVLFNVAFNSFVLRRGLMYYWWDPVAIQFRFKSVIPDNFYPLYDGNLVAKAIYVHRRLTEALHDEYPRYRDLIYEDSGTELVPVHGQDQPRVGGPGYTTVIDYYDADGHYARCMGDAFVDGDLAYPIKEVPFIDVPCFVVGDEIEPQNLWSQIVELNQYLCQLLSQKADIIKKYSNPTIVDYGSGQTPEQIRRAVQGDGSVIPARRESRIEIMTWSGETPGIDEQVGFVLDAMYDLSGKPRAAFGQTITNQSGTVTNLSLNPTLQSNEYHESIWGKRLSTLNERCLQLTEKFAAGKDMSYQGYAPAGAGLGARRWMDTSILGADIGGWYKNRIKWPSAVRTDDPAYVQSDLSQLTSDPPAISLYTSLENRGVEDVEAEIDRISEELMDPRLHPDRMQASMDQAQQMGDMMMPQMPDMGGGAPPSPMPPGPGMANPMAALNSGYTASAVPDKSATLAVAKTV